MGDGEAFLVQADALQAQGDPLGELIVIEHALVERPGDRALAQRQRKLLLEYAFLGRKDEARWFELVRTARAVFARAAGPSYRYEQRFIARYDVDEVAPRRWQPRLMGVPAIREVALHHAHWELVGVEQDTAEWRGVFELRTSEERDAVFARMQTELRVGWPIIALADGTLAEATEIEPGDADLGAIGDR